MQWSIDQHVANKDITARLGYKLTMSIRETRHVAANHDIPQRIFQGSDIRDVFDRSSDDLDSSVSIDR